MRKFLPFASPPGSKSFEAPNNPRVILLIPVLKPRAHSSPQFLPRFAACATALTLLAICLGCGSLPFPEGAVYGTANPQVAVYSVFPGASADVTIAFGKTTSYGMLTSTRHTPPTGGAVTIYVAGMQGNTIYHMQAIVKYADGTVVKDADHTFHTGSYPNWFGPLTASTTPGQTPQPGIEIVNSPNQQGEIMAVDLSGNVLWAYNPGNIGASTWLAPKLLPDGDFIATASTESSSALVTTIAPTDANLVREFDLAGNTVKQITMSELNGELAAAGYNVNLSLFSHDVTVLPNGHWIVLANMLKNVVLNGQTTPTQVLGDVIVDLDTNLKPVWVWNEFDHLDVNRHPWNFPDWTHTNAIIYSPDDGNLLVSIRHQNWIVKVDYENGHGTGNILWHLGEGGDFKLIGGTDPTDWSYAQHGINFTTQYTAGVFGLAVMDNGDDRIYPGQTAVLNCGANGAPACYTSVPVYQIDESAMTATLVFHQIVPSNLYSFWGGNAEMLANGDIEYDLCGTTSGSRFIEVTNQPNPQTVWTLTLSDANAYRAYRLPSLYPGVQW